MKDFEYIRPYYDDEVNDVLKEFRFHPFMKALLSFTFPNKSEEEWFELLDQCKSIYDFQIKITSKSIWTILEKSCDELTSEGFTNLLNDKSYLYMSNHRDIVLDTSILNILLQREGKVLTASAIGDNLVQKSALMKLSKLNRNFIVQRDLQPREILKSSIIISEYISDLITNNRSVWLAQREGRTKDGNDKTQQGLLKMLSFGKKNKSLLDHFKKLNITPVSISYEFDPTDISKMPELMAKHYDIEYIKTKNEDFNTILQGAIGYKGRIHLNVSKPINDTILKIFSTNKTTNEQLQDLKQLIDITIIKNYKLWPSNYVAYDSIYGTDHTNLYTEKEQRQFERRVERRVEKGNKVALNHFLNMYANPVINKLKIKKEEKEFLRNI